MGRFIGNACKRSRRVGLDLGLKSDYTKPLSSKCRLSILPGQHGKGVRKKISNYSVQLTAKQSLKYIYGIFEKQLKKYYFSSLNGLNLPGVELLMLLESRLDSVVYRMGFASTRAESRQLVSHKTILVKRNNSSVFITVYSPSFSVSIGDEVMVREKSIGQKRISEALKLAKNYGFVKWIHVDLNKMRGVYLRNPKRDELSSRINEQLVIEWYSKY
jgi:small subunit ribosomal protein S4